MLNRRRQLFPLLTAMMLLLGVGASMVPHGPVAFAAEPAFCEAPSGNPYFQQLNDLPQLQEPPLGKPLPIPPRVYLKPVTGPLVVRGESIGFRLIARRRPDGLVPKPTQWSVRVKVSLVDQNGNLRRTVKEVEEHISIGKNANLTFTTSRKSATYRVDVVVKRIRGGKAIRYGQYFRAGPPRSAARLGIHSDHLQAGGALLVRLENAGFKRVSAGYGYVIEHFNGTSWEMDPSLQDERSVPRVLRILAPTATFDCLELPIPSEQMAGQYRVVKEVGLGGRGLSRPNRIERRFVIT